MVAFFIMPAKHLGHSGGTFLLHHEPQSLVGFRFGRRNSGRTLGRLAHFACCGARGEQADAINAIVAVIGLRAGRKKSRPNGNRTSSRQSLCRRTVACTQCWSPSLQTSRSNPRTNRCRGRQASRRLQVGICLWRKTRVRRSTRSETRRPCSLRGGTGTADLLHLLHDLSRQDDRCQQTPGRLVLSKNIWQSRLDLEWLMDMHQGHSVLASVG